MQKRSLSHYGVVAQLFHPCSEYRAPRSRECMSGIGDAILWLAGLHALAALYHHLVLKDGVLASMLPRWISFR